MGNLSVALGNSSESAHRVSRRFYVAAGRCSPELHSVFDFPTTLPPLFLGGRAEFQRYQCRRTSCSAPLRYGAESDEPYQPVTGPQQYRRPTIRFFLRQLWTTLSVRF